MPTILLTDDDLLEAIRDLVNKRDLTKAIGTPMYGSQMMSRLKTPEELAAKPGALWTFEVRLTPYTPPSDDK